MATHPMSWSEMVEQEMSQTPAAARTPGHAVHVHEKLSAPSRKRCLNDSIQRHQERQTKAEELRKSLLVQQKDRLQQLAQKVKVVRERRAQIADEKKGLLDCRMAKAQQNREQQIQAIVKKAHDEDEKVHEIAFINSLEADNKRNELLLRDQDHEQRLLSIQEERQRKQEGKAARESQAEERRQKLEVERQARIAEQVEKKNVRNKQIEQQREVLERERIQIAKDKAKEREERIAGIVANDLASKTDLKNRLQLKQEESQRRYEVSIEHIKQKATDLSAPGPRTPVGSGHGSSLTSSVDDGLNAASQHLGGSEKPVICAKQLHQQLSTVLETTGDGVGQTSTGTTRPTQQHKVPKKTGKRGRRSKRRHSLQHSESVSSAEACVLNGDLEAATERCAEPKSVIDVCSEILTVSDAQTPRFQLDVDLITSVRASLRPADDTCIISIGVVSGLRAKLQKVLKELAEVVVDIGFEKCWLDKNVHGVERALGEISRLLSGPSAGKEQKEFVDDGRVTSSLLEIVSLLTVGEDGCQNATIPLKTIQTALQTADLILKTARVDERHRASLCARVLDAWLCQFSGVLTFIQRSKAATKKQLKRGDHGSMEMLASQLATILVTLLTGDSPRHDDFDKVIEYFCVMGSVDLIGLFVQSMVTTKCFGGDDTQLLLHNNIELVKAFIGVDNGGSCSCLIQHMLDTNLCGLLSLIYCVLLNPVTIANSGPSNTMLLNKPVIDFLHCSFDLILAYAQRSHQYFQKCMGDGLEFRHVCSFILNYCSSVCDSPLLDKIIVLIGYFVVENSCNQELLTGGSNPTVLHQLLLQPINYFCSEKSNVLLPTLISCAFENETVCDVVREEMALGTLGQFIETEEKRNSDEMSASLQCGLDARFRRDLWNRAKIFFNKD